MSLFVERWGAPYLPAQFATTVAAMFATFALNRRWTFG
jgi:putative flippase GtrA